MTEKLLTGTLSLNTKKQTKILLFITRLKTKNISELCYLFQTLDFPTVAKSSLYLVTTPRAWFKVVKIIILVSKDLMA